MKKLMVAMGFLGFAGLRAMDSHELKHLVEKQRWSTLSSAIQAGQVSGKELSAYPKSTLDTPDKASNLTLFQILIRDAVFKAREDQPGTSDIIWNKASSQATQLFNCIEWLVVTGCITHSQDLLKVWHSQPLVDCHQLYSMIQFAKDSCEGDVSNAIKTGYWLFVAKRIAEGRISKAYIQKLTGYQKLRLAQTAFRLSQQPDHIAQKSGLVSFHNELVAEVQKEMHPVMYSILCNPYKYCLVGALTLLLPVLAWNYYGATSENQNNKQDDEKDDQ